MLKTIRQFFTPPFFPEDEDKTRTARILYALLTNMLAVLALGTIATIFVFVYKTRVSFLILAIFCFLMTSRALAQRGRVREACALFVVGMWIACTLMLVAGGRITTAFVAVHVSIAVIAGTLLGRRSAIIFAALSTLVCLGLAMLQSADYFPLGYSPPAPPMSHWVMLAFAFLLTITPLNLTLKGSAQSLARARESEKRYATLFNEAPMKYLIIRNEDGVPIIRDCNAAFLKNLGYTREQVVGQPLTRFYTSQSHSALLEEGSFQQALRNEITTPLTRDLVTQDGRVIHTLLRVAPEVDGAEQPIGILAMYLDITERKRAEEALIESESRFRLLAENSTDMISLHDAQGNYLYVSPACRVLLGYEPEELIGHSAFEFIHPDDIPAVDQSRSTIIEQPIVSTTVFRIRRKDGEYIWLETTSRTIFDKETGAVLEIHAASRNVTERKRAAEALQESENLYRKMNENSPLGMHFYKLNDNNQLVFVDANPAADNLLGTDNSQFIGKTIEEAFPPLIQTEVPERYRDAAAKGIPWSIEQIAYDDKQIRGAFEVRAFQTTPGNMVAVFADITERKRVEVALNESQRKMLTLLSNLDGMAYSCRNDPRWTMEFVSEGTLGLTGYAPDDLIGNKRVSFVDIMYPEDRDKVRDDIEEALVKKEPYQITYRIINADGAIKWVWEQGRGVFTEFGEFVSLEGFITDITERKQAEEALQKSEEKYRLLTENTIIGIYIIQDNKLAYVNPMLAKMFRYSPEEIIGKLAPSDLIHPDETFTVAQRMRNRFAGKIEDSVIYRGIKKDGEVFNIEVQSVLTDYEGKPAMLGTLLDVTERMRAEEALRESEERYRTLAEASHDLITLVNRQWKIEFANTFAAQQFDIPPDTLPGKHLADVYPPEVAARQQTNLQHVLDNGQPYYIEEAVVFSGRTAWLGSWHVPIKDKDDQINIVLSVSRDITKRKIAEEKLSQQLDQLQLLRAIDAAIISSVDLVSNLYLIVKKTKEQLQVDAAVILLLDSQKRTLHFAAGEGYYANTLQFTCLKMGEGPAGRAAHERNVIHIPDLRVSDINPTLKQVVDEEGFIAYFGIPLIAKGQLLGVLEIFHRSPLTADPEWLSFIETLAGQVSISIDSATLFSDLQKSNAELESAYDATLEGWSHAMDLRDKETEGHTRRVTEMAVKLAQVMGLSDEEILQIKRGALLHDIGKMGIPDAILLKPDKLTDAEWVIMRKHPVYARDMLSRIEYLKPALDIPYCHHERWDGTGYPQGLKGKQIPLAARLFSVVDVWDALSYDRPYRPGWPKERVIEHIRTQAGTHFDPKVVEIFLRLLHNN